MVMKQIKATILFSLILWVVGQLSFAQTGVFTIRKSQVSFVSDAPLELIKAKSTQLRGVLEPDKRVFAFVIPSNSFEGFNNPLQQIHFYENYIEASKYPEDSFKGKIIEQINFNNDGEYQIRAKGGLIIHGVEQERIIKVKIRLSKGVMYATSDFSILLQEHNITIPRVVYQKIAEEINIHVSMELTRK
jgi:hypothetical protein